VFHGYHGVYPEVGMPCRCARSALAGLLAAHAFLRCKATPPFPFQENKLGQKFVVDATLLTDLSRAGRSDDLSRTVNYARVYE
jgi:hypothetical protein